MADSYFTIEHPGEGLFKEKMSKFISFARKVTDPEEAKAVVKQFQNEYHDSRHVCWAYMIGPDRAVWQLNDNGEPSGTAGKPILGQINSKNLTNVLVVVVRYFGGIKLGTSGLITAYKEAAREALDNCEIVECHEMRDFTVTFSYMDMDGIMRVIKGEGIEILDKNFDNLCSMSLRTREDDYEKVAGMLAGKGGRIDNI